MATVKKINQGQIFFPQEVCEKWFNKIKKFTGSLLLIVFFFMIIIFFFLRYYFVVMEIENMIFALGSLSVIITKKIESKPI